MAQRERAAAQRAMRGTARREVRRGGKILTGRHVMAPARYASCRVAICGVDMAERRRTEYDESSLQVDAIRYVERRALRLRHTRCSRAASVSRDDAITMLRYVDTLMPDVIVTRFCRYAPAPPAMPRRAMSRFTRSGGAAALTLIFFAGAVAAIDITLICCLRLLICWFSLPILPRRCCCFIRFATRQLLIRYAYTPPLCR